MATLSAATFTTGGQTYSAFRYELPGGKASYYDADGRSLKRFFSPRRSSSSRV